MDTRQKITALDCEAPKEILGAAPATQRGPLDRDAGAAAGASPNTPEVLTEREREVLRWTAEGKTAFEIGLIVGLTERTVNFHIGRVLIKLAATNKTQAAVKAARLGILS